VLPHVLTTGAIDLGEANELVVIRIGRTLVPPSPPLPRRARVSIWAEDQVRRVWGSRDGRLVTGSARAARPLLSGATRPALSFRSPLVGWARDTTPMACLSIDVRCAPSRVSICGAASP